VETQLRRAVVTIAARIAEAASHGHAPPFAQHLGVALSAAREASYLILLLSDLDELSTSSHAKLEARVDEIARMLVALIRRHPPRARSQKPSLQPTKARIRLGAESGAGACVSRA
jgi:four helix bundle protein